jgi:DNA-binding NarL/FixJ family response regulator
MNDIRVAIVEDIDEIRDAMRVLIGGSQGFECIEVYPEGESAVAALPKSKADVVLMDIHLPGISGIECVAELKEKMPATQFMMVTVYDDDDNIFNALQAGASGYILKRTSPAQILEAIREVHNGGSPMSSEIARRVVESLRKKKNLSSESEILTEREREILDYVSKGYIYKEIAEALFISIGTVKVHLRNIYEKLQVQNKTEALNKVFPR